MRTTPAIGGSGTGRQMKYAPAPAATGSRAGVTLRRSLWLAMRVPPLGDRGRYHREGEVDPGEEPQPSPRMHYLPQARAELADPDEAVDGEVRREDVAHGLN